METIYVAISGHGFGHATRTIAVINTWRRLLRQRGSPDVLPIFVTGIPMWLFERSVEGEFLYRGRGLDVGVIQSDSLRMDLAATHRALVELQQRAPSLIRAEADFIRLNRCRLVFADLPPLAAAIAQAAGIPCWVAGNFGWDFIYRGFGEAFADVVGWIEGLNQQCDRTFRLPFHEPMASFPNRTDIGLTGAEPKYDRQTIASKLHLDPDRPTILLTFGGLGLETVPYDNIRDFPDWQFLTLESKAPDLPNLQCLNGQMWRPVDVMPLCQAILCKPGYGTFSEAIRTGIGVYALTRDGFAEAPLLLEGLQRYAPHRILPHSQVLTGPWDFLNQPLSPPRDPGGIDLEGNRSLATELADFFS
ncbi:MAG: hypothetical protein Q6J68_07000 [Thermostichales cyanobacterium SZTDM-1c_bins_54]